MIDCKLFINGEEMEDPKHMQLNYYVETNGQLLTDKQFRTLNVSKEDRHFLQKPGAGLMNMIGIQPASVNVYGQAMYNPVYNIPLTKDAYEKLQRSGWAKTIIREPEAFGGDIFYPVDYETGWKRDNYGPIWIPAKGATVTLTPLNLALYSRCIRNFEGNDLKVENDKIFINGQETTQYTFKYDYYFMMGDNRHKSADSRSWGFVPEDHVVGEPLLVWLSLDKDRGLFDGAIRWNRLFHTVNSLK
jgi:signal peptidase I